MTRPPDPFAPWQLGPLHLRNRFVKAATFEGMTPGGLVSDELIEYHRRPAAGGVGCVTVAYCSVSSAGRTYRHQLWMRDEAVPGLRRLADAVHDEGAAVALQLGHAGWFANPKATREPAVGPSRKFSPYGMGWPRAATTADLGEIRDQFASAVRLAAESGADAVEVHVGHGYLLSQFLSPYTNRRTDAYGGSIENRARFPREVLAAVREAAGDRLAVWAKLNMADGFRGGLELVDGVQVARWIEQDGSVDALQLTGGFTARTPMYLMRGEVPLADMLDVERDPIRRIGLRAVAPRLLKPWPFEEAFFRPFAREMRAAVDLPLMLLGGINRFDTVTQAMADGFDAVAMARALLREPDLVRKFAEGTSGEALCVHCNRCVVEMDRGGTRCVLVP